MAIEKDQSISAEEMKTALNEKINYSDCLSLWDIRTTDLTRKIPSAAAIRDSLSVSSYHNAGESTKIKVPSNFVIIIAGDGNDNCYLGLVAGYVLATIVSKGYTSTDISIDADRGEITLPLSSWYRYIIIK